MSPRQTVLAALLLMPFALLAMAKYVVVDIRQDGPDAMRLWIPVPLAAARAALQFAPEEARHVRNKDLKEFLPLLRTAAQELNNIGDSELVRVDDGDQHVRVAISGVDLVVDVSTPDEEVHVALPVGALQEFLDRFDGECLHPSDLLSALGGVSGDLVHVKNRENEVRVSLW